MRRALALAGGAAAFASPNPAVGCVLVRDGTVLGEGVHRYDERDHAEVAALKQAAARGRDVRGATAYVTLEPCSHHGRTGPCADALVAVGVARCVVATVDPNPLVRGKGLAKLRAGRVLVNVFAAGSVGGSDATGAREREESAIAWQARRLNDAFALAIQQGRPMVTLKAAVSSDGMLAPAPATRAEAKPYWLTGEAARADVQRLRHASDAILAGIGTVLADDPGLTDRTGTPRRRPLLRVVLDSSLRLQLASHLVRSAAQDVLVLCEASAPVEREAELRACGVAVERISRTGGGLDLYAVLQALQKRDVRSVLVEGGSALNGSLIRAELVDRAVLYVAPVVLGAGGVPFARGCEPPAEWIERLSAVERVSFMHGGEQDVRVTGYLRDPWDAVALSDTSSL